MSTEKRLSRRDELETLLPFYLNGTLEGDDLTAVQDWLETEPDAQASLAEAELEFEETSAANDVITPPTDALARFSRSLDAITPAANVNETPSLAQRLTGWLRGANSGLAWGAAAALLAVLVVQNVGSRTGGSEAVTVAGSEDPVGSMPFALVTFSPDASMEKVLAVLSETGAVVISGPNGGVFKIGIPAKSASEYDTVLRRFEAAGITQAVIAGRKPVDG